MGNYYIYILECADKTYYTGYTNNLDRRLQAHNAGKGAKYTRCRLPVTRVYEEVFDSKSQAMKREYAIKQMSRKLKERLIKGEN